MLILEQEFPIAFLTAGEQEGEAALSVAISFSTLPVYIAFLFNRTEPSDSDFAPAIAPVLSIHLTCLQPARVAKRTGHRLKPVPPEGNRGVSQKQIA